MCFYIDSRSLTRNDPPPFVAIAGGNTCLVTEIKMLYQTNRTTLFKIKIGVLYSSFIPKVSQSLLLYSRGFFTLQLYESCLCRTTIYNNCFVSRPAPRGGHCTKDGAKTSQKPFLLRFLPVFSLGYWGCPPGGAGLFQIVIKTSAARSRCSSTSRSRLKASCSAAAIAAFRSSSLHSA